MKRLFSILLCLVMCLGCSLTAFAGGPRAEEGMLAVQNMDDTTETLSLLNGLRVGSVYKLRSMASSASNPFVLNVPGGNDTKKLDMWTPDTNGEPDQKFRLVPSNSYYKLIAECSASGKVLDAYRINNEIINGCSADLWSENDTPAQQLVITSESSGGYSVRLASNTSLALTAVSLTNGGAVQFQTYTDVPTQRWDFVIQNDTISLSRTPDPDAQNKTEWCWAASAKMVGVNNGGLNSKISTDAQSLTNTDGIKNPFYGYGNVNGTTKYFADGVQYAILRYIKDTDGNQSGSDADKENALQFASANLMDIGSSGYYKDVLSDSLIAMIQTELLKGNYIIGNVCNNNYKNVHSVVIKSYLSSSDEYVVFNPWDETEQTVSEYDLFHNYGYKYSEYQFGRVSWFQYCR